MPATERPFFSSTDLPPGHLYLDTDVIIHALIRSQPHHDRCVRFLARVAQQGWTTIHLSTLSWSAVAHRLAHPKFREGLPMDVRRQYRLDHWDRSDVRRRYLSEHLAQAAELLEPFEWEELSLTPEILRTALGIMVEYNLGSQDAIHLATMRQAGVVDLASFDKRFRRVDWLYLWNDRIYQGEPA